MKGCSHVTRGRRGEHANLESHQCFARGAVSGVHRPRSLGRLAFPGRDDRRGPCVRGPGRRRVSDVAVLSRVRGSGRGKTSEREDRYTARFVELTPPARIVVAITFDTVDPAFSGEMTMAVTFEDRDGGTDVTIVFEHIPPGIRPEDNDAGTRSSLEKLARYSERDR